MRSNSVRIGLPLPMGGECRQCGGELVYLSIRNTPDGISYSYFCRKCKLVGEEVYDLVHSGDKFHGKKRSLAAAENFFGVQAAPEIASTAAQRYAPGYERKFKKGVK